MIACCQETINKGKMASVTTPNDQVNNKSQLTSLIVGGDRNCTLSKNDKVGGAPWKPSSYCNLILTTLAMFDLVDIQRMHHPKSITC